MALLFLQRCSKPAMQWRKTDNRLNTIWLAVNSHFTTWTCVLNKTLQVPDERWMWDSVTQTDGTTATFWIWLMWCYDHKIKNSQNWFYKIIKDGPGLFWVFFFLNEIYICLFRRRKKKLSAGGRTWRKCILLAVRFAKTLYLAFDTGSAWYMSLVMRHVSSGVSNQVRLKLACSATKASMRLESLVTETRDITLSRQRTAKALIRLRGCAGWSAPLLSAYDIRHVFSCPGAYVFAHLSRRLTRWPYSIPMVRCPSVVHTFKLEYPWDHLANIVQILCLKSLGWGKRLHKDLRQIVFHGNQKIPYNGKNVVSTIGPLFVIGSSSNLQITWTGIKSLLIRLSARTNYSLLSYLTLSA